MTTTPPGWYDDGHGAQRWWDGTQWTAHVHTPDAAAPPTTGTSAAQAGYPVAPAQAGYPADYSGGGAFIAATEPRRSKLWILWVVLGVVILGIVVLAAILIPIFIGMFSHAVSSATSGATSGGTSTSAPTTSSADQEDAVAAVKMYDQAWATADCDKLFTSTTTAFRDANQLSDCPTFQSISNDFTDTKDNYLLTVDDVESSGATIIVYTTETYDALYDDAGNLLDTPEPYGNYFTYTLVRDGELWAIDTVESVTN
ncbi:DUF2510 domain-containing protein [Microbacterium rhizomatis]|uniref:DUF2510 domain-containing protein n=1 Tax=Microbacterium rhizomatis TaxID=1631477 RepID=A0A5J5J2V3_9MICO|nr:DUF2510 domain-containing protein [Microbacterium rhizomatis]KAA9107690.1 DUF2510 domain-containing protein [Microbacterium rhizomatis]